MRLFTDPRCFDLDTCRRIRRAVDCGQVDPAEVLSDEVSVQDAVRRTSSVDVDIATLAFVERALDAYRDRAAKYFGVALHDREGAGFLRYVAGGFYRPHRDRAISRDWPGAARRRLTVVAFLNDDFSGGELQLIPDDEPPVLIQPRAGMLVMFDAGVLHEVLPVVDGTRDTIVDWLLGES